MSAVSAERLLEILKVFKNYLNQHEHFKRNRSKLMPDVSIKNQEDVKSFSKCFAIKSSYETNTHLHTGDI